MRKLTNSIVILILTISFLFTGCNQQIPDDNISEVLPADSLVTSAKESSSKTSSKTSKNSSKGGSSVKNSSKTQPSDPFVAALKNERQKIKDSLTSTIMKRFNPEYALDGTGDLARVSSVMRKAKQGKKITVGILGDSISGGAGASSSDNGYGALIRDWWTDVFGEANVKYVNASIGSNTLVNIVHRMDDHLLSANPDIVFLGYWKIHNPAVENQNALESIIKRMLDKNIAVVCIQLYNSDTTDKDISEMTKMAKYYKLPLVSFANALNNSHIAWAKISADALHPNDYGHTLIAASVNTFLTNTAEKLSSISTSPAALPTFSLKADGWMYVSATLLDRSDSTKLTVSNIGSAQNAEWTAKSFSFKGFKLGTKPLVVNLPKISTLHLLCLYQSGGGKVYVSVTGKSGLVFCKNVEVPTLASTDSSYSWPSSMLASKINEPVTVSLYSDTSATILGFMVTQ